MPPHLPLPSRSASLNPPKHCQLETQQSWLPTCFKPKAGAWVGGRGGGWAGRPLRWAPSAQSARPLRGLALQEHASAPAYQGPSPTLGQRERSRERLLKFLCGEINTEAISEQVFQLWAWRLSSIPVTGTDSFLICLCHPPQIS